MDEFGGEVEITRRSDNHHPTVWGDHFLAYANLLGDNEWEEKEHKDLKEEVRKMLVISPSKSLQKLELINTIQLLGVAYHFEHEIEESLSNIYNGYEEWIGEFAESHDLHAVALSFRLLRQQGYYVSYDVFRKFTDDQGNYNKAMVKDMQGLLSLYEATQFRVHDEEILDEAVNFATTHLKLLLPKLSNSLSMQVSYALKYPINKTIARVATRKYLSFYQEDKSCDQVLLNFAKLDFNTLQKMHKRELCDITRWWKELNLANELPFTRDRVVELYFWSLGVYFEPQNKVARIILAKVLCFVSITTDDIYDTYGTLHELTLLTNAIERWNIDAAENLAPYMKIFYTALLHLYKEVENELAKENKSFRVNFPISEMKKLVGAYLQEAEWFHGNTIPRMEEYMKNGIETSVIPNLTAASWLGMGDEATKEAFKWITTEPPILIASSIIARLLNDIVSHEREMERGDVASGIECYMNEYDATKEEAYMEMRKIIENNWKDLNQQCLKPTTVPRVLLMTVLNLIRTSEFFYKDEDAYTSSKNNLKDVISMVLVDPIKV
ncbi:sesquiterpene synthase 15b-like [Solanum verrucosum]|uniref:sesquiterpene synthase 15b-like n=1 Tax=Solanum verrucosum TaxID=315347 RepID=UPI0020D0E4EC|nr:sesquiterpene synthase 15b-like [Solanum verrucosum]